MGEDDQWRSHDAKRGDNLQLVKPINNGNHGQLQTEGERKCNYYRMLLVIDHVQGILSKMAPREFSIFIIFSDAYTCS